MSGRFVSAGTAEDPPERDEEWIKAQKELEDNARRKKEEGSGIQEGGKTLYEVLQANKAAKQEALEESMRLKNQFRSLDEDEVDFLDSVLESTRAKDEAVRKETTEQLNAFRKQQEEAEKAAKSDLQDDPPVEEDEQWTVSSKKRKKRRDSETKRGFKLRRTSSSTDQALSTSVPTRSMVAGPSLPDQSDATSKDKEVGQVSSKAPPAAPLPDVTTIKKTQLGAKESTTEVVEQSVSQPNISGLVDYSTDDE